MHDNYKIFMQISFEIDEPSLIVFTDFYFDFMLFFSMFLWMSVLLFEWGRAQ